MERSRQDTVTDLILNFGISKSMSQSASYYLTRVLGTVDRAEYNSFGQY